MSEAIETSTPATRAAESSAPATAHRSWLAVEVAGQGLLFPLAQAGEIFPMVPVVTLAHTEPWFSGVANLRGHLHGVIDLAGFLGLRRPTERMPVGIGRGDQARLLALNPELRVHCALKVDHLAGLRRLDDMVPLPTEGSRPAFAGPLWQDNQGRCWQEIDLAALARSESFLAIAAPTAA
jgi:twitching motility protein PilI